MYALFYKVIRTIKQEGKFEFDGRRGRVKPLAWNPKLSNLFKSA